MTPTGFVVALRFVGSVDGAARNPLPSWTGVAAKTAILADVRNATQEGSVGYIGGSSSTRRDWRVTYPFEKK